MIQESGSVEQGRAAKCFTDAGTYTIISLDNNHRRVESGTFSVNTGPVSQSPSGGDLEWESLYHLNPDGQLITSSENDFVGIHDAYGIPGKVHGLWPLVEDPDGSRAKIVHDKIKDLIRRNTPSKEVDEQVDMLIRELINLNNSPELLP
jgi:hypothetical protein